MSIHRRSLSLGSFMLLGACFSPGAQLTDATSDTATTTTATMSSTSEPTTSDPTSGTSAQTTSTTTDPTGGACESCESVTPYCIEGECVECIMSSDCLAPGAICDPDSHTCIADESPCQHHIDCASEACEIDTSVCFPPAARHYFVDAGVPCGSTECTDADPCCQLGAAMTAIAADAGTHHIVHVAEGTYNQGFGLTTDGVRVAVLAVGDTLIQSESGNPVIMAGVMPPSPLDIKLYLQGLTITGIGSTAVVCQSVSFLGLEDITVRDLEGNGLLTADCTVWSRRSQFLRNFGGLSMSASTVRLENSIISGSTTTPALTVSALSELEILYSTVAQQAGVPTTLLKCGGDPGTVTIRNSALLHDAIPFSIDCLATITTANSAVSSAALDIGPPAGNKVLGADQVSPNFVDWAGSDLHVVDNVTALKDVALWKTGDPLTDIDGEARPNVDQALDVAGADVPGG